ncbi:MAG: hypothetical protein KGL63_04960 [Betaproteobacteria bacterium]|nr:hypothetical protein [Betaproteobacteria bacterium]
MAINFCTYQAPIFKKLHVETLLGLRDAPKWKPSASVVETALCFDALEFCLAGQPRVLSINLIARLQKISSGTVYRRLEIAKDWARAVSFMDADAISDWLGNFGQQPPWTGRTHWGMYRRGEHVRHQINNMVAV